MNYKEYHTKLIKELDNQQFLLPANEIGEILGSKNKANLFIGGSVNLLNQTITFLRGNLEYLTVSFSIFTD